MNTPSLRPRLLALLLAVSSLGACSVSTSWKTLGGTPEWQPALAAPSPDIAVPGTLGIRYFCPTLEEGDFAERLAERIRAAAVQSAVGPMERLTDRTKKPHYEIVLTEAGRDGTFAGNKTAGVLGAIGGGVATGLSTRHVGLAFGGALLAGGASYLAFAEKKDNLMFRVECYQYTSSEGSTKLRSNGNVKTIEAGGAVDAATSDMVSQTDVKDLVDNTYFDVKSHRLAWVKFFTVHAAGGVFTTEAGRSKAAAEEILAHFLSYVFGGRSVY